jgi:hypothetical protein
VTIADTKPVRYVRYNGTGGYLNVSEVEFLGFSPDKAAAAKPFPGASEPLFTGLLLGPFRVACHSPDGKLLGEWIVKDQSSFPSFGNLHPRSILPRMVIVSIKDPQGRQSCFKRLLMK